MSFIPFPTIQSDRLYLRMTNSDDVATIHFLRTSEVVNAYIKRDLNQSKENILEFINARIHDSEIGKSLYWCICLQGKAEMIGSICLWNFSDDRKIAELGYDMNPTHQNNGYMSEAIQAVLRFGFNTLDLQHIEAFTHHENESSKKVLTKNGFELLPERKDKNNLHNIIYRVSNQK